MINRNAPLRYEWITLHPPKWGRAYMARVNEYLVLNVHRLNPDSPTWEWLVIGFDMTKGEHPCIVEAGQAGSMKEAKALAEARVPQGTTRLGQQSLQWPNKENWPDKESTEVPF